MFKAVSSDQGTSRKLKTWASFVLSTVPFASIILVWFFQLRWPDVAVLFFAYLLLIPLTVALIWLRAGKGTTARRESLFIGFYAALGVKPSSYWTNTTTIYTEVETTIAAQPVIGLMTI